MCSITIDGCAKGITIAVVLSLTACGGGGGGGGGDSDPSDFSGTWEGQGTQDSNCGDDGTGSATLTITQTGNDVTITQSSPSATFQGTVNGNTATADSAFSFPEGGGTTTVTSWSATLDAGGNSFSGSSQFSYSEPGLSCSGTVTFSATRTSAGASANSFAIGTNGLDGIWRGHLEGKGSVMHEITMTIAGNQVTALLIDSQDSGATGVIGRETAKISGVEFSDGSSAHLIASNSGNHAMIVDDSLHLGVIERNVGSLPTYVQNDIALGASGQSFTLTGELPDSHDNSAISCDSVGNCTGRDELNGEFITPTPLTLENPHGRWAGTFSNGSGFHGPMTVLLSPDKQFAAGRSCDAGRAPGTCSFNAWRVD